jgi:hypothetical protein
MADATLTSQTAAGALGGTELLYGVQSGTKKITAAQVKTFTSASPTLVTPAIGVATGTSLALTNTTSTGFAVGRQGATTPSFAVDSSAGTQVAGLKVAGAAHAGTVAISVTDSSGAANLTIDALSTGTIGIGANSTGAVTITPALTLSAALTYGGVTLTNNVTGTGKMVLDASPTITGHATIEGVTATGATGTGKFVFDGTPTLATPVLGVATATSINKVALTAPSSSATLTIADGKTLTASNSITLAGTDSTTMTFPPASASIGYLGVPMNSQNAGYTLVLGDAGKCILMATAGTFTIPPNSGGGSVAFPVGTVVSFINGSTSSTIPITTDTMTLAGTATTGTRTLAANGIATAVKITSTTWIISGTGLT